MAVSGVTFLMLGGSTICTEMSGSGVWTLLQWILLIQEVPVSGAAGAGTPLHDPAVRLPGPKIGPAPSVFASASASFAPQNSRISC